MEHVDNSTVSPARLVHAQSGAGSGAQRADGSAYLYILIVVSFYGIFLSGIMLGYVRSKRREKRRTNVFTRLVHEEEQREWGALPAKHSLAFPALQPPPPPFCSNHGNGLGHLHCGNAPCTEQSSVSSLGSSADTRLVIEEEEAAEENATRGSGVSAHDSG